MEEHGDGSEEAPFHGLEGILRLIESAAEDALRYEKIKDEDRSQLEWAAPVLRSSIEKVLKILELVPYSHLTDGDMKLQSAVAAAFVIGMHASASESAKLFAYSRKQSEASKGRTKAIGLDAFDELAIAVYQSLTKRGGRAVSSEVWAAMIDRIRGDCADPNLEADEFGEEITLDRNVDGKARTPRKIKKTSFRTIFSNLKK